MIIMIMIAFSRRSNEAMDEFKGLSLKDLCVIATLGVGGFGRVELVSLCRVYAFFYFFAHIETE